MLELVSVLVYTEHKSHMICVDASVCRSFSGCVVGPWGEVSSHLLQCCCLYQYL